MSHTISQNHPTALGNFHFLSGNAFRPCRQLTRMGIIYDRSSATTDAEMMALKALVEPRKMQPKQITTTTVRTRAFSGNCSLGCTVAKNRDAGRPPSLCTLVQPSK